MDSNVDVTKSRRKLLTLLALSPLAALAPKLSFAADAQPASSFLAVSRSLTGTASLSQGVADRIERLLKARNPQFDVALANLAKVYSQALSPSQAADPLSAENLKFALEVAKPWYLGYVGEPSNSILKDDAEFATFLEAQSYEKVIKDVPRQSYPPGSAGWWGAVPEGVTPPPMPQAVTDWRFRPEATLSSIIDPSPAWLSYAEGTYANVDASRKARPKAT